MENNFSNHSYRQYLINNTDRIMNLTKTYQENQTLLNKNNIYIKSGNIMDSFSDLKQEQLNRINKLNKLNTPLL